MGYIYIVTNLINNKRYIGQSLCLDINTRWKQHTKQCKNSLGRCLFAAYNKYGIENFKFKIICICFDEDCNKYEKEYIKKYNTLVPNGYNLKDGGNNCKHHPETIKLISKKLKGRVCPEVSELTRKKRSENAKGNKNQNHGKPMSIEQKNKISESMKKMYEKRKNTHGYKVDSICLENLKKGREMSSGKLKKVAQYNLNGDFIASYDSLTSAAKSVNGHHSVIGNVCDEKKIHYKTYKGFLWKFIKT
jgi:group I intron endonuclease